MTIAAVLINSLVFAAQWFALSPNGNHDYIRMTSLLILPVMLSLLAIPLFALLMLKRDFRRIALLATAGCAIYGVVGWSLFYLASEYRLARFETVAEQSEYLVDAIRRYEIDKGYPPSRFEELVPAYIPDMPRTGMGAYPDFHYRVKKMDSDINNHWFNGPWSLYIDIPLNDKHSEKFIYFPQRDIPDHWEQNIIERVGDWIYVRD